MYSKILIALFLFFSFHSVAGISITTVHGTENELKINNALEALQKKYDLSPWIITNIIEIDEKARTPRMSTTVEK